jgi:hypothetical protein
VGDIRDIHYLPRRYGLLLCFLHQAHVQTRDQLVAMFLKRMRRITTAAKEHLHDLQQQHRDLEERMMAAFSEVLDQALLTPEDDTTLGHRVRHILATHGGATTLREHYEQVSAYHHDNYRPLMWGLYRSYRAAFFRLAYLLTFRSATQN